MQTKLNETSWKEMSEDAQKTYPHECCGFFFGEEKEGKRYIKEAVVVDNTREENRERRFEISAKDYMKAEQYAVLNDLTLLGVYHSHPDHPAIPSEYDRERAMPFFSYIIISVKNGQTNKVTSWRLNEQQSFDPEALEIETNDINITQLLTL